jgi:FtsH-binding integral membrane protein
MSELEVLPETDPSQIKAKPVVSAKFMRYFLRTALFWFGVGCIATCSNRENLSAFVQIFFFTFLDLAFLILIFWSIFFAETLPGLPQRNKTPQIFLFITFKLVCLGFLAIVLKRLANAPFLVIFLGIGFIGFGPLIAGVFTRNDLKKIR